MPKVPLGALLILGFFPGSVVAERAVTNDERIRLVAAVQEAGCTGGKVEAETGKFEVEDATCSDGKKYNLKFDTSFNLVGKDLKD